MDELSRRSVFRVAIVYLACAWLLLQVAATLAPILELPNWFQRSVLLLLVIGFPVALVLAWALELTPAGLKRDTGHESATKPRHRTFDFGIIFVLAVAVGYFVVDKYYLSDNATDRMGASSVAVLPFVNISQDPANEPFTVGIHGDILMHLSRISSINTTSRTTVFRYVDSAKPVRQIAQELGVATILEGGVQRAGDRVRINVQLVDAISDENLWAQTYDRQLTAANVFDIQSSIARTIAAQLRATLTQDEEEKLDAVPTQSMVALESYFIGKQLLDRRTRESLLEAVEHFEKVVEVDPEFALAWSGLADAYMLLPEYSASIDREVVSERSTYAVARALALDPDLPYVSSSAAWAKLIHEYDWAGAEETFMRALKVEPDNTSVLHWLSHTLSWQGRFDEAIDYARRAVNAEPYSRLLGVNLAYILVDARRYDEALQISDDLQLRNPEYSVLTRNLFLHELRAGLTERAVDSFVNYIRSVGADVEVARDIGAMFVAYAERGEVGSISEEQVDRAELGTEDLAQVLASVGDAEGALLALEEAIATRSGSRSVLSMKINPIYDFIRHDPRFIAMLARVGLGD